MSILLSLLFCQKLLPSSAKLMYDLLEKNHFERSALISMLQKNQLSEKRQHSLAKKKVKSNN